jgi:hypothetical protein
VSGSNGGTSFPVVPRPHGEPAALERVREGMTMALYVSLSLLAVMVALPVGAAPEDAESPALVILATSVGLILAHVVAFRISTRLVHHGRLPTESIELLAAQLAGGAVVTLLAVVPALVLGAPDGVRAAELVLLAFIAVVGYVTARNVPLGRARAGAYMVGVVVVTLLVLWVKNMVAH